MVERRKFTDYQKKTVYANGNGRCGICGKPIRFQDMTIDHKTLPAGDLPEHREFVSGNWEEI